MKKTFSISLLILFVFFSSCDKVNNPYPKTTTNPVDTGATVTHVRRVLLEDFTGHKCPNCPAAQREAEKLVEDPPTSYGERLIVMAIHAGYFSTPDPSGCYTYDFRTTVGTSIDAFFIPGLYPRGMINRKDYPANQHMKASGNWSTEIASVIDLPPDMDITIQNTYNAGTRKLDIDIESEFVTAQTGNFKIVVMLTEDSIIQCQKDGGTDVSGYVHKHVLRAAINGGGGQWGDALTAGVVSVVAGTKYQTSFSYTIPSTPVNINPDHAHVVAYVYDDDPASVRYKQILQAAEAKVVE